MAQPELLDLLRLYVREGIADWKAAHAELQSRARRCLGADIADNDAEAIISINTVYNGANTKALKFIPMPKVPKRGVERYFFLPIRHFGPRGEHVASFDLFALVGAQNCLGFRFEPAHKAPTPHGYAHVQLSPRLLRKTIVTKTLGWIPDSYPAFPIPPVAADPLKMFLSMATAVHGYAGGVDSVLQAALQRAGRVADLPGYLSELRQCLH